MPPTKSVTVLIVAGEFLTSLQLAHIIEQSVVPNVSILTAFNGTEGLSKARQRRPDLIIAGLAMPKMDGFDMVQSIRQEKYFKSIPIIGINGSDDPADIKTRAFRELCDAYLEKPFFHHEVIEKVNLFLPFDRLS